MLPLGDVWRPDLVSKAVDAVSHETVQIICVPDVPDLLLSESHDSSQGTLTAGLR
jgi:hypothetical protein